MSIVTLAQAKLHLRVDGTDEDTLIQVYLNAAERSIANYLNRELYETDAGSDLDGLVMNDAIKGAVLLQVGHLYANRESVSQQPGNYMLELPLGLKWLVDPYRIEMGV